MEHPQNIWLIRHGFRLDVHDPNWLKDAVRPYDTPLAPDGFVQAEEVGRRLSQENVKHLFASPFLRAMQTADRISRELKLPIQIEHGLCEAYFPNWFPVQPTFPSAAEFAVDFSTVDVNHRSAVEPAYPESPEQLNIRTLATARALIERARGDIALITHGGAITSLCRALLNRAPSVHAACCCLIQLTRHENEWKIVRDGKDTSHLSKTESTLRFA